MHTHVYKHVRVDPSLTAEHKTRKSTVCDAMLSLHNARTLCFSLLTTPNHAPLLCPRSSFPAPAPASTSTCARSQHSRLCEKLGLPSPHEGETDEEMARRLHEEYNAGGGGRGGGLGFGGGVGGTLAGNYGNQMEQVNVNVE